jgi:alginate O-acetyltransferase complex protein AlgI
MFFNSWAYLVFLPTVLAAYWLLPRTWRVPALLVASYVFYGWWDYRFLALIWISTIVDFWVGRRLSVTEPNRARRRLLAVSLVVNLGILGFFKYWGFFVESASDLLGSFGFDPDPAVLSVILPVGISFYTFQTMSYTIDIYRRQLEPEQNLTRFALFVAFFPQLVAGPIERASRLLPQIREIPERIRTKVDWRGAGALIARGLFRKVVIADGVAPIVNEVFATPNRYGGITLAVGVVAFSLQIYGDFAGYTDIARGSARLFGVELMENFKFPYSSQGFSEFWRRWHISLSTWLRDYLYIPMGGNQGSRLETARNLMITMLLGGLWHGAGWGFVIWGGLHGLYLLLERVAFWVRGARPSFPSWLVFIVVSLTWIPFRAATSTTAVEVVTGLADPLGGAQLTFAPITVALLGLASLVLDRSDVEGRVNPLTQNPPLVRGLAYGFAVVMVLMFWPEVSPPFIYFQF